MSIFGITKKYNKKIDPLDLELLIASSIKKPREFVLAHPEYKIPAIRNPKLETLIRRRMSGEPLAYILGQKEFYGLNFKVNRHTLIPRPETELLVDEVLKLKPENATIIDVGTGSGNIIISLAKSLKGRNKFMAVDISGLALAVAKQNAKKHSVDKKIKFLRGNLLEPILKAKSSASPAGGQKLKANKLIITANLPYLSKNIYASVSPDIKKYEPKSALLSGKNGLAHYENILKQIIILKNRCSMFHVSCFMEIGPEQKNRLPKLLRIVWPDAKIDFQRDLAGKWRLARATLN